MLFFVWGMILLIKIDLWGWFNLFRGLIDFIVLVAITLIYPNWLNLFSDFLGFIYDSLKLIGFNGIL